MHTSNPPVGREGVLRSLAERWRNWTRHRRALDELNGCGHDETALIAQDIGVAPAELRTLAAKWPDASDLLSRRITAAGIQQEQIEARQPQALRGLQRVCSQCQERGRCERDLDRYKNGRGWRGYCPNVVTLDALRTEERDRRLLRRSRKWRSF